MLPILIVGAGPTGLALALWLRKKNIPFRIVDKAPRAGESSRALAIQARTLEFYRQLGIADEIVQAGIQARELKVHRKGKRVATAPLGEAGRGISSFSYLLFLSQDVHEAILNRKLKDLGVEIERETEILSLEQDSDGVSAELQSPRGKEKLRAPYLCGCDGAHSRVRHLLKVDFPGAPYDQVFFVADVEAQGEMAGGGVQISVSEEGFCIVMPIERKASIRLTGVIPPEAERKETITFEDVRESVVKNTGLAIQKLNWFSSYRIHHRMAENFQRGRVFLSGDASHIHSPAGGQGMNTGIGDAFNLAWKLTEVLQGRANAKILASYEVERMAFARQLLAFTDRAFQLIASRSAFGTLWRMYILPTAVATVTRFPKVVRAMFLLISQTRIEYRSSPLSVAGAEGIFRAGDRLPWIRFPDGRDNYEPLQELKWQLQVYGRASDELSQVGRKLDLPLFVFPYSENARERGLDESIPYLLRPDGHLALRVSKVTEIETYFADLKKSG